MLDIETELPVNEVVDNKVRLPPPAGVAHFKPVASALSATNLNLEQSQRIVQ
jgi:hypothetical protein